MKNEVLSGIFGTSLSAIGTIIQTNEMLQTISLVTTIIGGIITLIIIPILNWWRKAKKDGKVTKEEIEEGVDIVVDGVNELNDKLDKEKEEN